MDNSSVTDARLAGKETEDGKAKIKVKGVGQECRTHTGPTRYGLLSRLRSYFFFDPLIWFYTLAFGVASIPFGFFDKDGSILHWFAHAWSKTIMKTIFSPMRIAGL